MERECPVCGAKRYGNNAMMPKSFACGSYIYESRKNRQHFKQSKDCVKQEE